MPEVTITFKGGPGYDDPWIVVKGQTFAEANDLATELRDAGAFSAVRLMANEFRQAPAAGVETVQAAMPGSQVIGEHTAVPGIEQGRPACETCGMPTRETSGTGRNGSWKGYACTSGNRDHTKYL